MRDTGPNVIADSMQLIAGRSGQEYNQRKTRHGAFWEDRYHATAVDADEHLHAYALVPAVPAVQSLRSVQAA